jgi:hypothetical protein
LFPAQTCGLGRARTAFAKAEAHFSIWGHTEALCVATLVKLTSYACFYRARDWRGPKGPPQPR